LRLTYTLFHVIAFLFFLLLPPPPRSTLFPYTTLFRSSIWSLAQLQKSIDNVRRHTRQREQHIARSPRQVHSCVRVHSEIVHRSRSEEHTSELQSRGHLVCRLLLEKKKKKHIT